jgi:DNA-binding transcriptional ArsR family regulator
MVMEAVVEATSRSSTERAFDELLAADPPSAGTVRALAAMAVDALAEGNRSLLEEMREGLRRRLGAWLAGAQRSPDDPVGNVAGVLRVIEAAAQRLSASQPPAGFGPGTYAHRLLQAIAQDPGVSNTELRERLGVDETEVSRTGRRLREAGLASRRRFGTVNSWTLSPAGDRLLEAMPEAAMAGATATAAATATATAAVTTSPPEPEPLFVNVDEDRATVTAVSGTQVLGSRTVEPGRDLIRERLMAVAEREYGLVIGKRTAEDIALALGPDGHKWSAEIKVRGLTKDGRAKTVTLQSSEALAPLLVDGISAAIRDIFEFVGVGVAGDLRKKGAIVFGNTLESHGLAAHVHEDLGNVNLGLSFLMAAELEATRGALAGRASRVGSVGRADKSMRTFGSPKSKRSDPDRTEAG